MGALTSKPFSFTARSWELSDKLVYDFTDTFFSAIKISFRGTSVMRILPEFTQSMISEWISDRTRFSYDAVTLSNKSSDRLVSRKVSLASVSWLSFFCKRFPQLLFAYPVSSFFDLASSKRLLNCVFFSGFTSPTKFSFDFRGSYFTDYGNFSNIASKFKQFFLVGVNVRYQLPVFAASLRRLSQQGDTNFFSFGFFTNNLFAEINMGFDFSNISNFFRAKSRVSRFLFSNFNNSVILTTPQIKNFFNDVPELEVFPFFDIPSKLSFVESTGVSTYPFDKSSFLCVPHPFTYVTYNLRDKKYQKFESPYSSIFYGNSTIFFIHNVRLSSNFGDFSAFSPVDFTNYSFVNFYSHFTDSFFYANSLNILISLKRQTDSRSSFIYYT